MIEDNPPSEVLLDLTRQERTGLAEAVFCAGKTDSQLVTICAQIKSESKPMLFTRLTEQQFTHIDVHFPDLIDYDPISKTGFVRRTPLTGKTSVGIVTGGSSDVAVAREASRTLAFYGHAALEIDDIGVAGLWRLLDAVPTLQDLKIVICIAGMDAALPTVLGGLIPASIIAVPTSVGYGMTRGGETALQSLLVSCAPGLTVVNIDNGYGAACAAIRILKQISNST